MKHKTFRGGVHPKGYKELSLGSPIEDFLPSGDLVFPVNHDVRVKRYFDPYDTRIASHFMLSQS